MDFFKIRERSTKRGVIEVYPDFIVGKSKDLMIRGKSFYAVWDAENNIWTKDMYRLVTMIDKELYSYGDNLKKKSEELVIVKSVTSYGTKHWKEFMQFVQSCNDNYHELDNKVVFANTSTRKNDYISHRLDYNLEKGDDSYYDELMSTIYDPDERTKLEWAVGSVIAGDSRYIQKLVVLYGNAGAGKSTFLNIVQAMFPGYYTMFEAKALVSNNNTFSTETFKNNPLVAIQHDGDLSKIEDNTKLNSIVSHEEMLVNEKFKAGYTTRINCMLFMGTNTPVKVTDSKSGIIRRLIDVTPSGDRLGIKRYTEVQSQIPFELGAIAWRCLEVYRSLGKNYYIDYIPLQMIQKTNEMYFFVDENFDTFAEEDQITLKQAWAMYREFSQDANGRMMKKIDFADELKNYFNEFYERTRIGENRYRNLYVGFKKDKFAQNPLKANPGDTGDAISLVLDQTESLFDKECSDIPAQYANDEGTPYYKWDNVKTKLSDIDTSKLHYCKVPQNMVIIDFDLKNTEGKKDATLNLEAASKFPPTYAEYSQGGAGVHLHYYYDGNVSKLSRVYSEGIEVKVFTGNSSLRRRLSMCNNTPIRHINSGLPLKEEKVIDFQAVRSEQSLRRLIKRNLRKEIHPGTKPSIDFICKILDEAYESDLKYDVSDMKPRILAFANNSTNHAKYCIQCVENMKFASEPDEESHEKVVDPYSGEKLVFFDCEVFPNLFLINWKYDGSDTVQRMINPTPQEVGKFLKMKLVGFNNRRYDNHIVYARYLGYSNHDLFELSKKIIDGNRSYLFGEAYNLSYTDVYDFSTKKQSLKKWEIELGIHHMEWALPWDEPVPEDLWVKVAEYCDNDVIATEAVFHHLSKDWATRKVLAKLSGLSVNDSTNSHSARIIFGKESHPQSEFVYTDLSKMFPGYKFENGVSTYRGEQTGEGGYVYSEPGMYNNVALLDIASMHPTSIEQLNLFGDYTKRFSMIKQARIDIKHHNLEDATRLLGDSIKDIDLKTDEDYKNLAQSLKIVINSVYGLTSAKFDNKFRDPRNIDNIVAKRGALFMVDLKHECQDRGWTVVHIKTDSIKLANATPEMINFVTEFGKKYGYNFEHEATYSKMCIVNDAVYIAKLAEGDDGMRPSKNSPWTATGAQFAQPYLFKTLFSHEPITIDDMSEAKSVKTAMYLDLNESLPPWKHNYKFIGKSGLFCPILPGHGGGTLLRASKDKFFKLKPEYYNYKLDDGRHPPKWADPKDVGKRLDPKLYSEEPGLQYYNVTGTKGYRWMEYEQVATMHLEEYIDRNYYKHLVDEAIADISQYGDFEQFAS